MNKPQFAILRFAKYKGPEISNIEAHNERTKEEYASNPDIDKSRSHLNFHLLEPDRKYRAEAERQIKDAGCRTRSDSVRLVEALVTATPEFFKGKKKAEIKAYFQEALDMLLSDVKLSNYKERTAQVMAFLDKYIPDVAAMETQMKKYHKCFTTAEAEKAVLKAENESLTDKLEKSQQQSTLKKLQDAKLQSDYEAAQAVLERIPPDIIKAYTQRGNRERKVDQYSALE